MTDISGSKLILRTVLGPGWSASEALGTWIMEEEAWQVVPFPRFFKVRGANNKAFNEAVFAFTSTSKGNWSEYG